MTPLRWLIAGTLVNRVGTSVRFFVVLYLADARGMEPATAGAIASLWGLGALASQPVVGALADRFGRRTALAGCMSGAAVAIVGLGAARAEWLIAVAAFLAGGFGEGFRPAVRAMLADISAPGERTRAFGWEYWATNVGFTVAMLTGGALAAAGWWWLFAVDAASCAVFAVIALARLPETRPARGEHDPPGSYGPVLRDRLLLGISGLQLCFGLMLFQAFATVPLVMRADGHGSAEYGVVMALAGVLVVVGQHTSAARIERAGRGSAIGGGLALVALGFAGHGLATSAVEHALAALVWTSGEIMIAAVIGATVADIAPDHLRGRYMGIFAMSMPLAAAIAPAAGTLLLETGGESLLWPAAAAVGVVGAAAALALSPALARRTLSPGSPRSA